MAHTTRKKTPFLKKRKTKRLGPIEHRLRSRFRNRRGSRLRTQTAKPGKNTKAGRALIRRGQEHSRKMRRLFGLNTGRTRRVINNNVVMENVMKEAERQIKEAQLRRSRRKQGLNVEPEAEAAAEVIASGRRLRKTARLSAIPEGTASASIFGGPGGPVVPIHSARNVAHTVRNPVSYSSNKENSNNEMISALTSKIGKFGIH